MKSTLEGDIKSLKSKLRKYKKRKGLFKRRDKGDVKFDKDLDFSSEEEDKKNFDEDGDYQGMEAFGFNKDVLEGNHLFTRIIYLPKNGFLSCVSFLNFLI